MTKKAKSGAHMAFLRSLVGRNDNECVPWPFPSRCEDNYGVVQYEGRLTGAHRVMCRLAHGEPPTPKHHAAHSCGRSICVNPLHLRWATASENEADKKLHGTVPHSNGLPRLSENQVRRIKRRLTTVERGDITHLAFQFGVARKTINDIRFGKTWRHISAWTGVSNANRIS